MVKILILTLVFQSTVNTVEQQVNAQVATIAALQTDVDAVKAAQTTTDNTVAALQGTVTGLSTAMAAQVSNLSIFGIVLSFCLGLLFLQVLTFIHKLCVLL